MNTRQKPAHPARVVERGFFDQYLMSIADGTRPEFVIGGLAMALARIAASPEMVEKISAGALAVLRDRRDRPFTTSRDPLIRKTNLKKAV